MRRFSSGLIVASLWVLMTASGCMHKGSNNSAAKSVSGYEESDQDLAGETNSRPPAVDAECQKFLDGMCTMEYNRQSCTYEGEKIDAGNPCTAMNQARFIACQKKLTFQESNLKCTSVDAPISTDEKQSGDAGQAAEADTETANVCQEATMCTREMRPSVCTVSTPYQEISERGNNPCEALNKLGEKFCADNKGAKFDRKAAICKDAR